ncbi:histone chaperone RTT106-like [Pecten maximus]|uniref:histone chaperone RTT106-like n=1 Tax=Pecten maximus TaxID=6579 RepID=UPI001458CAE0|nr:histone chaperone RTT106-like [Pecten maximus]
MMYLPPSSIHFTHCTGETDIGDLTKDIDLERLTAKFENKGTLPKIQVVEKDGHYFTLNNIQLQVFRKLEEKGHCQNVKVEVIATKRVPVAIRDLMTLPPELDLERDGYSTESHRLGKNGSSNDNDSGEEDEEDDEEDDSTVTSCSVASSSETDTSDEDDKDDDSYDSSTSGSVVEEIEEERESLL